MFFFKNECEVLIFFCFLRQRRTGWYAINSVVNAYVDEVKGIRTKTYEFDYINWPFPDETWTYEIGYLEREIREESEIGQIYKTLIEYYNACEDAKARNVQPPAKPQGNAVAIPAALSAEVPLHVIIYFSFLINYIFNFYYFLLGPIYLQMHQQLPADMCAGLLPASVR